MELMKIEQSPKDPCAFTISSNTKTFTLLAENEKVKDEWFNEIHNSIIKWKRSGRLSKIGRRDEVKQDFYAPLWAADNESEICMICKAKFTTWFRRHHCRKCGRIICANCSKFELFMSAKKKNERACDDCFFGVFQEGWRYE